MHREQQRSSFPPWRFIRPVYRAEGSFTADAIVEAKAALKEGDAESPVPGSDLAWRIYMFPATFTKPAKTVRAIVADAVWLKSDGIILAHNPQAAIAGHAKPNSGQLKRPARACKAIGLTLLEHLPLPEVIVAACGEWVCSNLSSVWGNQQ